MNKFPWFSVDSTSWFMIGMYGKLCVPLDIHGNVILDDTTPIFDKFEVSTSEVKNAKIVIVLIVIRILHIIIKNVQHKLISIWIIYTVNLT